MKFLDISIENFLAISSANVRLGDRGLVLVQGENEDDPSASSNGAGKSSIADAVCWVLYGQTAREESGDAIINRKAGKDCRVDLEIQDGTTLWKITRFRKHKTGKNGLTVWEYPHGGTPVDHSKGTDKLTQEVVDKLIGCSYDVFRAAIYAGQEQMPDLPAMTDKFLKVLIEEAAGTSVLETAHVIARDRLRNATDTMRTNQENLERARMALDQRKENLDHAVTRRDAWSIDSDRLKKELNDAMTALAGQIEYCEKQMVALDGPGLAGKRMVLKAKIEAVDDERRTETTLVAEAAALEAQISAKRALLGVFKKDVEGLKASYESVKDRVGQPCTTCGKPYCEEDIEDAREIARKTLGDKVDAFRTMRASAEELILKLAPIEAKLEAHRAKMTDLSAVHREMRVVEADIEKLNSLKADAQVLEERHNGMVKRLDELVVQENPFEIEIAKETILLRVQKDQVERLEKAVIKQDKELAKLKRVVDVFSTAGVRAHVLDTVTPFLNDRTANYLGSLSDGNISANWTTLTRTAKGELREKFSIEVSNDKGGETFGLLSGGEKRKVRIATALALQDLVASRATKQIELFIGDEIDDGLDEPGLERLMGVLEEKARERGSVFVISHRSLKDWCSNVLTVKKSGGSSTIVEGE